ncbi:MAG: transposase [Promethearchaeota archaeon]
MKNSLIHSPLGVKHIRYPDNLNTVSYMNDNPRQGEIELESNNTFHLVFSTSEIGVSASDIELEFWDEFVNPTEDTPVQAMDFMRFVDLSPLESIIESFFSDNPRAKNAFRFPPMATLKALIYGKIKSYAFLTNVHKDLLSIDGLPEILGYEDSLPSYDQLRKFANEIMGIEGIKKLLDKMIKINLREGLKHGLNIGEEITMDACPIQACPKDKDAQVNGHYYKTMKIYKCYLWHNMRCKTTRLPLVFHLNHGNDDEGKYFLPFLMKAKHLGVSFKKTWIDCGYATKENIASAKVFYDLDIVTNIANDWKPNLDANYETINKQYQKLWKSPIFDPYADMEYKEMALIMTNDSHDDVEKPVNRLHKLLGDWYRNDILAKYSEASDSYLDDYHERNEVESTHGTEKRIGSVKRTEVRGLHNNTVQLGLHLLMLHVVANTRMRHGITEGLTNIGNIC